MVGLVLVGHSAQLVQSVRDLVEQMVRGRVRIAIAGGMDDPENPFGTNAVAIQQAIESVYSDDGVVVLMDLGSALLNAETALDLLPEAHRARVRLCPAPLVEGAVSAAVAAAIGNDIDRVVSEAERALEDKAQQLQPAAPPTEKVVAQKPSGAARELCIQVNSRFGLHARPAAALVYVAARFRSQIQVTNLDRGRGPANATSISQLAALDVRPGHRIAIRADGLDAADALAAINALVELNFGEPEREAPAERQPPGVVVPMPGERGGIPVSGGVAIGHSAIYRPADLPARDGMADDPQAEMSRLDSALQEAREQIEVLLARTAAQVGAWDAGIFKSHQAVLDDQALIEAVRGRIARDRVKAERAWQLAMDEAIATQWALESPYLRERAADLADVKGRVLQLLVGGDSTLPMPREPSILVVEELAPSHVLQIDPQLVLGICSERGGANSHAGILARALGIPAVFGVKLERGRLRPDSVLALNGDTGQVWVNPDAETLAQLRAARDRWLALQQAARQFSSQPAMTRDGRQIRVAANVAAVADTRAALKEGADGVGLLRSEFMYLDRVSPPSEEEQLAVYASIAKLLEERPLVIRTLDVGGDKPLQYLEAGPERNPFLGVRGIRLSLNHRDIFRTQLRAILRASAGGNVKVMFPMISSLTELREAKAILAEAQGELRVADIPFDEEMDVGIMIEIPSAVALADQLAGEVDFFSIGTNDLSQYVMAADRTNAGVAPLADALHPAVLRMIRSTVDVAHATGVWVSVCGELGGDPLATPILVGLQVDELSMSPAAVPAVQQAIARLAMEQAAGIAAAALDLPSAEAVRAYLRQQISA